MKTLDTGGKSYGFNLFGKIYIHLTISSSWIWVDELEDLMYFYLFAFSVVTNKDTNHKIISIVLLPLSIKLVWLKNKKVG